MDFKLINPESLGRPSGYTNGLLAKPGGQLLFISGQVGWNHKQEIESRDLVEQFDKALANVIQVVREAGGRPDQIARLIIYVTDRDEYRQNTGRLGAKYRQHMDKHFPAMVLVEVKGLLDPNAKVEIEGIAVL